MAEHPLIVDLPYPPLDGITRDPRSARIIAPAYAAAQSELTAVMQYTYHAQWFEALGDEANRALLLDISMAEMEHFEILGAMLIKLGVDPIYTALPPLPRNYYSAATVAYSKTPVKMLMDDISGEWNAIKEYKRMLAELTNEKVAAVIQRIVLDEELHLEQLRKALASERGD